MSDSQMIRIFDTTLRDGEQSPGATLNLQEKIEIARKLEAMGVDVIEAGFPITSQGDFDSVSAISQEIQNSIVCGLSRCVPRDVERAGEAIKKAKHGRVHVFCATSKIHRENKLNKAIDEIIKISVESVKQAREYTDDVEFSPEDATRSEWDFLVELVTRVVEAGATTINIPDTVGYTTPEEYGALFAHLIKHVPNSQNIRFSAHCHNDLGMATANSLAAVKNGARQIECTINGIGERAGNTAMEEVAMALRTRGEFYGLHTNIRTEEIIRSSRLIRQVTGMSVQPNKAIVGDNAFAHESGIHQDGVLKNRLTYEIMTPESVGLESNRMVLGRHSGRHAFKDRLVRLGYILEEEEFQQVWNRFLDLADKKKEVYDEDILSLVNDAQSDQDFQRYELSSLHVSAGSGSVPTATVRLIDRENPEEPRTITDAACGDGPVDAIYNVLERLTGLAIKVDRFRIQPLSEGRDAQAVASVLLKIGDRSFAGKATSTDIVEASARAYLDAINRSFTAQTEEITETL